jgi:hypothetical protein
MPDTTPWTATLDEAGYFVTERRRVVAKMVADSDSLFTANELVGEAKAARVSVGRATVFGALELSPIGADCYRSRAQLRHNLRLNIERSSTMAFTFTNRKGITYTLHRTEATLQNGQRRTLYYFAREVKPNAIDAVPAGYVVTEGPSGLPVLKKG